MAELLLNECMEKARTESNLSIVNTNNDMNVELSKEFFTELQSNAYRGKFDEDVVDHIAKVLEMLDLIKVFNVDTDRLRVKVFPLSLADDANNDDMRIDRMTKSALCQSWIDGWGNNESSDGIVSSDDEWEEYEYGNPPDTTTDSFFKPYMETQEENIIKRIYEQGHTKRKYNNTSNSNDEKPNKRVCKAKKFKAIKYSLRTDEKYLAINENEYGDLMNTSKEAIHTYQEIFRIMDE
ncbi:hypothetical protein Tco_1222867 [Tanacetum coccineum]